MTLISSSISTQGDFVVGSEGRASQLEFTETDVVAAGFSVKTQQGSNFSKTLIDAHRVWVDDLAKVVANSADFVASDGNIRIRSQNSLTLSSVNFTAQGHQVLLEAVPARVDAEGRDLSDPDVIDFYRSQGWSLDEGRDNAIRISDARVQSGSFEVESSGKTFASNLTVATGKAVIRAYLDVRLTSDDFVTDALTLKSESADLMLDQASDAGVWNARGAVLLSAQKAQLS